MAAEEPAIDFIDLKTQRERLEPGLTRAVADVMGSGFYIGGPRVQELEAALADFCGVRACVSCANGTDALALVLKAWGVGAGDAVFVPAFTFVATASVAANLGATPVFVDVLAETFNMDPDSLVAAIAWARGAGLRPAAVIPVDLFGQPADYARIEPIAEAQGLRILCDAAQSFGARLGGRAVGAIGAAAAISFYPSKPLGCYGDGGAVLTDDPDLAATLRSLASHGMGAHRYEHVRIGGNSRLDAIQAAVLLAKMSIFADELDRRQAVADRYAAALEDAFIVPRLADHTRSAWAQYTIRAPDRDQLAEACRRAGVPTAIHYPMALSQQPAFRHFPAAPGGVPVSEALAASVLSLPMHPYLTPAAQDRVVAVLRSAAMPGLRSAAG